MPEYSYQRALGLLKSIELVAQREHLNELFAIDGFDFFEAYRHRIFSDIKGYKKGAEPASYHGWTGEVRVFLLNMLGIIVSALGVLQLLIMRKKILVYSPDKLSDPAKHHDFRIDEVYSFLQRTRLPYTEILHTTINRTFFLNILRRRRLPVYLESFNFLYGVLTFLGFLKEVDVTRVDQISFDEVDVADRMLARLLLKKYLIEFQVSLFKVELLARILRLSNSKILLTIDDPRYYNELLIATKRCGIYSIAFQHGHFTKYHVGWLSAHTKGYASVAPDRLYVWGAYWKKELKMLDSFIVPEAIGVAVPSKFLTTLSVGGHHNAGGEILRVLVPYETEAPKEEVKKYLKAIGNCKNTEIIFKIRSDISEKIQCDEYGIFPGKNVRVLKTIDLSVVQIDVVVGIYSTFLYDMIAYDIPVGILKTSMDYGEGMVRNALAELITEDDVCSSLERLKNTPASVRLDRKKRVYQESSPSVGQVLVELVASLSEKR
ncbi:MAG: hypothetical protein RLZZ347_465 [Candidatus Parcubacteria bacterium]|jgi:hypothetical protein